MADDEVRPVTEPPRPDSATPNRGRRREPATFDGTALEPSDVATPLPDAELLKPSTADAPVEEPSMASTGADLSSATPPAADPVGPTEPSATPRRSRFPALLTALGVLLVLLLGAVLYTLYNPPGGDAATGLAAETAALKQRLAALESRPAPTADLKPLQDRITALDATVGQLKTDLAARPAAASESDLTPLQGRIDALDKGLTGLRESVAALPKTDPAPLEAKLADLGRQASATQAAVAALPRVDLAPLDGRVADLDRRLKPLEAALATPKAGQQVTEARQEGSAAETRAAPLAVVAQAAVSAIQDGRPFADAVRALGALGVAGPRLAALQAVAAKGAADDAALLAGFEAVKDRILAADAPAPATGGVLDRLMSGAQSLVKVRPAGTLAGNDPDAVVSRIEAALRARDLKSAADEAARLPEAAKAPAQAWTERLQARIAAEAAARAIGTEAIAAIAPAETAPTAPAPVAPAQ